MSESRWTILDTFGDNRTAAKWLCRCECGTTRLVKHNTLINGHSRSCGCLRKESKGTGVRIYATPEAAAEAKRAQSRARYRIRSRAARQPVVTKPVWMKQTTF